jgi:hypothetical protein
VPNLEFAGGINAVRLLLPRCRFDATTCALGIESLRQYRRQFNARTGEFTGTPVHDRHSHAADAQAATRGRPDLSIPVSPELDVALNAEPRAKT